MNILDKVVKNVKEGPKEIKSPISKQPKIIKYFSANKFFAQQKAKLIQELRNNKQRNYLRASELGDCAIQLYFRLKNAPVDMHRAARNHYLRLMAQVGNAVHDFIQKEYEFSHVEYSINSERYRIHARVDGVIDNSVLVEIKTVSNCQLLRDKDLMQLGANYLLLLDADFSIDAGQLVYVERTLTRVQTFEFAKQELDYYAKQVEAKTKYLFSCLEKEQVPDKFLNEKNCPWCEYHNLCPMKKNQKRDSK